MGSDKMLCLVLLSLTLSSQFDSGFSSNSQPSHQSFSRYSRRRGGGHNVTQGPSSSDQGDERKFYVTDGQPVQLQIQDKYVVIDNGLLQLTFTNPGGIITGIKYNGIDNLLEVLNQETNRGYWDISWSDQATTRKGGNYDRLAGTSLKVIVQNPDLVEISFTNTWDPSLQSQAVPLNIDIRYIVLRGSSGFYTYGIYEHLDQYPAFDLDSNRIVFKPRKDKFHYMAITDTRQRYMPLPDDRLPNRGQVLAYPEAVKLVNPIEPQFKGEVDDKYEYSCEHKDILVHGWISTLSPPVGFWQITPSNEFRSGGPLKQELTSHVGPTTLSMFHSTHYVGVDMIIHFGPNEPWKKVFGPVFIYLNSLSGGEDPLSLWEDAKRQAASEVQKWPYDFVASADFPSYRERGCVSGRLMVLDRFVSDSNVPASYAYIGLALPGLVGSWQTESKGYQFWTQADKDGYFKISNVRPGDYYLYASIPGFIGGYSNNKIIYVTPGSDMELGSLVYEPPRNGPMLWEIGFPDRSAAEFFIPDPDPNYINKLYLYQDRFRQYGLWERYTDLYPNEDLVFTVGISHYAKDWYFSQVTRNKGNNTYSGTTWQIKFNLNEVNTKGIYVLRLALATANVAELMVWINDPKAPSPLFSTGVVGHDNTIARHGIHGLYRLFNINIPGAHLQQGVNTIFLTQTKSTSPFQGVMYDYIRLEGPPTSTF